MEEGLRGEVRSASGLTGGRAHRLWENGPRLLGPRVTEILARAIATLEVNAAMGLIVAAPTAGAAGVLPAVLVSMEEFQALGEDALVDAMLVAGGVGGVIAHRASLSGAEGGCQAETGTAAAMSAAAVTFLSGGSHAQISTAVALTLRTLAGMDVHLQDERLTSREAESRLAEREPDWRRRKARLDAAAAAIILQDFLDARGRDEAPDAL